MKKSLLALAVMGTVAGAASAQSSVTIYGLVDAGIARESGGVAGSVTKLTSGMQSANRLGFRGTEDLGNGLSAFFNLETGMQIDTGALGQGGLIFGRQAVVGLKNSYGTLTLGRQYTPVAQIQGEMDPFGTEMTGTSANMMSAGGVGGNNRSPNTINYRLPSGLGGLNGELAYTFGEVAGSTTASREVGGLVGYANGPLSVKLGYHSFNSAASVPGRVTWLGGRYNFGMATGFLNYAVNKGTAIRGPSASGIVNSDSTDVMVGVTVPVGASKFLVSYIKKNDKSAVNNDASQFAVGYTYALSKRTNFYTAYAQIKNDVAAGTSSFYTVGNATELGTGDKGFNIGVRHTF